MGCGGHCSHSPLKARATFMLVMRVSASGLWVVDAWRLCLAEAGLQLPI